MISSLLTFSLLVLLCSPCCCKSTEKMIARDAQLAADQCLLMESNLKPNTMPRYYQNGELVLAKMMWWCTGFFPGSCWYSYVLTGRDDIHQTALRQSERMMDVSQYLHNHDAGFQVMCSLGLAYKFTGDEKYLAPILEGAEYLAKRFNPTVGAIKSWDKKKYMYPVIIDNMMNLELLTFAAKKFNRPDFMEIAKSHADNTIKNHFRTDFSSYHVVDYNPEDGSVIRKITAQGYNDDSAWSRGQSWGLYGYTMMYRETGDAAYLAQAENIADYLLPLLAKKPVPMWDFNAPKELSMYDDASAGAVMAAAYIELSTLTADKAKAKKYLAQAKATLKALSSPKYLAKQGEIGGFILKHSTGHCMNNSEVDVPLTYADYYFLEALYRLNNLK